MNDKEKLSHVLELLIAGRNKDARKLLQGYLDEQKENTMTIVKTGKQETN